MYIYTRNDIITKLNTANSNTRVIEYHIWLIGIGKTYFKLPQPHLLPTNTKLHILFILYLGTSSSFCAAGNYVLQNHKTKKAKLIKRGERERERERPGWVGERNQFCFQSFVFIGFLCDYTRRIKCSKTNFRYFCG